MVAENRRGLRIGLCTVFCVLIIIGLAGLIVFLVLYFDKSSSDQSVNPDEVEYIYKDLNTKSIFNLATGKFIIFREFWGYQCNQSKCIRTKGPKDNLRSLDLCALTCLPKGPIWPQPTGYVNISQNIEYIDWTQTTFQYIPDDESLDQYWKESTERFLKIMQTKFSKYGVPINDGKALEIVIGILHKSLDLTVDTDENYKLVLEMKTEKNCVAYISADNYFGARHGLETLSYLIVHDEWTNKIFIPQYVNITDGPEFKYRSVLIDTSRNYFSPNILKRIIDVMALTKLNTFHWHFIDIQSFPLILLSNPNLAMDGAYSKDETYNAKDIKNIIEYARIRGIRVIPEFDSPSRVGEGWQTTNLTVCFNGKFLCEDNPDKICGQFDVTNEIVYSTLNSIYEEMFAVFGTPHFFHMGGADVSYECWNSSQKIQSWMMKNRFSLNNEGFLKLWALFETRAISIIKRLLVNNRKIILWQNRLNKSNYFKYKFDKNNILIQIINNTNGELEYYLEKGFQVILSLVNLEKHWLDIYQSNVLISNYKKKDQIIGQEVCLWSHFVDEYTVDGKMWPKVSAFGESLWTNPKIDFYDVGIRISLHRNFLTYFGIAADAIGTEWCLKNINAKVCYCP